MNYIIFYPQNDTVDNLIILLANDDKDFRDVIRTLFTPVATYLRSLISLVFLNDSITGKVLTMQVTTLVKKR